MVKLSIIRQLYESLICLHTFSKSKTLISLTFLGLLVVESQSNTIHPDVLSPAVYTSAATS